jgi:phage repressor protein C with HTH and peptisase S24 domain
VIINPNIPEYEIYHLVRKYIVRSINGDTYADEILSKLSTVAENRQLQIYETAISDSLSDISDFDYYQLGKSVKGSKRIAYSSDESLNEYFELYYPSKKGNGKNSFEDFCKSNNLNPENLMIMPITGNSMINADIHDGDTAIVDCTKIPNHRDIAAISVNNQYYIKRILKQNGNLILFSENPDYEPYKLTPNDDFRFIGKVTNIIKMMKI